MNLHLASVQSLVLLALLLLCGNLPAQTDSSKQDFYPHHLNDKWVYEIHDVFVDTLDVTIIFDSTDSNGSSHLRFALSTRNPLNPPTDYWHPYQKVDSTGNLFWGNGQTYPFLQFKADAHLGERWSTGYDMDTALVKKITDTLILGMATTLKQIDHRMGIEGYGEWFAGGLGMISHLGDYAMPGKLYLLAARIGGRKFGDTTLVVNSVVAAPEAPVLYELLPNYPNPFNPSTTIGYTLPRQARVSLTVCNVLGEKVAQLVEGQAEAGHHEITFDATGLPSGVYFCRLAANNFVQVRKLVLLR